MSTSLSKSLHLTRRPLKEWLVNVGQELTLVCLLIGQTDLIMYFWTNSEMFGEMRDRVDATMVDV